MHPIIFQIGDITLKPVVVWVMAILALFFFSWAQSYGMARNWKWGKIALWCIIFIVIGDAIVYFAWNALHALKPVYFPLEYTVHNVNIYAYGLMLTTAFILGTILTIQTAKKEKISAEIILDLITCIIIGAIIGARALFVLLKLKEYKDNPTSILFITQGGLSAHGGVAGGMLFAWFYTAYRKIKYWKIADLIAPQLSLGLAIGRIGCFLNGCCYGVKCANPDAWYGMKFPDNPHTGIDPNVVRHPAQLYMMVLDFAIFLYLRKFYKNRKFDGHVFLMWLMLKSIARFFQEFYRFDVSSDVIFGMMTIAQLASIILALIALVIILEMKKRVEMSKRLAQETQKTPKAKHEKAEKPALEKEKPETEEKTEGSTGPES